MLNSSLPVILIPAYQPDELLIGLVSKLHHKFTLIVINDGSDAHYDHIFEQLKNMPNIVLLTHHKNQGKGAALRTGFQYWLKHFAAHTPGVITADSDGQHSFIDIIKLADFFTRNTTALCLGVREFDKKEIPWRSRFGNQLTKFVFSQYTGINLKDTQTGLRAIPKAIVEHMIAHTSDGYEFELEMLIDATRSYCQIKEIPIKTVYLDANKSSHFNPLVDSLKIYFVFIRFSLISILSALLDFSIFFALFHFSKSIAISQIFARCFSGTFNFILNKRLVFSHTGKPYISALKYLILAITLATTAGILIKYCYMILGNIYWAKLIGESAIYAISFLAQRYIIFKKTE